MTWSWMGWVLASLLAGSLLMLAGALLPSNLLISAGVFLVGWANGALAVGSVVWGYGRRRPRDERARQREVSWPAAPPTRSHR